MPSPPAGVPAPDDVPAHLAVLTGAVTLERDGAPKPAELNTVLMAGDRLRTDRGRAEIMFGDGSALDLDNATSVELVSDSLVHLGAGALRLSITRLSNDIEYRVEAAGSSAHIASAGDFLISLVEARRSPELDLAVYRGTAELENAHGRVVVRAGMHAWATEDSAPSTPASFNTSASDDFNAWVESERSAQATSDASYLPSEMRAYSGALDASGTWQNDPTYGEVWYPQVDSGWQPYSDGYWSSVGGYGWFWVGRTPWSYPTHHYGRWGNSSGRWFWVPDHQWGPGWVNWSTTPGFVGWQPLGPTANGHTHGTFSPAPLPDMHRGWMTMPSQQFGMPGFPVWPSPAPMPGAPTTAPRPGGGTLMPPVPLSTGPALKSPTGTRTRVAPRPQPLPAATSRQSDAGATPGRELHSPSHSPAGSSSFSSSSFPRAPVTTPGDMTSQPRPEGGNRGDGRGANSWGRAGAAVGGPARSELQGGRGPAQLPAHPTDKPTGGRSDEPFHPGHVPSQFSRPAQPAAPPAGSAGKAAPAGRGRGGI